MSLSDLYRQQIESGLIEPDAGQRLVLEHLDTLAQQLALPPRLFPRRKSPRGLYLHGDVGRGKSMLMDLFFQVAPVTRKRRVHFDAFMLDVHARLHRARQTGGDPIPVVVRDLAREIRLLCFDEFQVNDIADAMILSRLFGGLLDRGVVVVATSNAAPDDLYPNGLQRALFLPFIALLKARLNIVAMANGIDHRLMRLAGRPIWIVPDDATGTKAMDLLFADIAHGDPVRPLILDIAGRSLPVPVAARRICRFSFADLCDTALGASDYLALATRFAVIMVDHVPVLTSDRHNETLRFIALVDQVYDLRRLVIASSAGPIDAICAADSLHAVQYRRTASRLHEMQSLDYTTQTTRHSV